MQISKLAKDLLKYLPVFAVLVAISLVFFLGRDLSPTPLDSHSRQPLIILRADSPCDTSNLYLTFPPKCKTLDGKFNPVPGSYIPVPPENK